MGAGVTESYAGAAPVRPRWAGWAVLTRNGVHGAFLAASLFVVLALTGFGTGPGPLGDCCGYGVGVTRGLGDTVTEGNVILRNQGWFPVVLGDVRPLPADGADAGLAATTVEIAELPAAGADYGTIGLADEEGYPHVPAARRHPVSGWVIPPEWRVGKDRGLAEVLVRYRILDEGTWTYRGYELTYRSGLVRHRVVIDVTMTACAPQSQFPDGCDPAE